MGVGVGRVLGGAVWYAQQPAGAILIDPPWRFITYNRKKSVASRTEADPYNTMSFEALMSLDMGVLAAPDCALFMWVVDAHLEQGLELGRHWGFNYKTIAFIWAKPSIGMGYWTRKEAEVCLLFTRGKPKRKSKSVRQLIYAPRREHSRKPDIYDRIEALVDGPYTEYFSRQSRLGWRSIGDEVGKFDEG